MFTAVSSVKANSVALGRPWGVDGAGAYLNEPERAFELPDERDRSGEVLRGQRLWLLGAELQPVAVDPTPLSWVQ